MRSVVPYLDLKAQYAALKPEIDAAVAGVLASGHFILGPEVAAFEHEFAAYCGAEQAIAVNSGTSALHAALLAAGVGPGDEVITTPFTFVATASAICSAGARPVFVDIEPRSFTMDPALLEGALTDRDEGDHPGAPLRSTVRHGSHPRVRQAAQARRHRRRGQAHGAHYKGRPVGSLGDFGCFSFYPGKNLGACGEGGAVVTNDANGARLTRMIRDWGQERKYEHVVHGIQLPDGRAAGSDSARQAPPPRCLDQRAPRRRAPL